MLRPWVVLLLQQQWTGVLPALPAALATLLAAGLTAFATVVAVGLNLFLTRVLRQGESDRRSALLAEAKERLAFWREWYEAQLLAQPAADPEPFRARMRAEVEVVTQGLRRGLSGPKKPNSTFRRALLLYKPANFLSWLPRLLFYCYAVKAGMFLERSIFEFRLTDFLAANGKSLFKQNLGPPPDHFSFGVLLSVIDPVGVAALVLGYLYALWFTFLMIVIVLTIRWIAVDLDKDNFSDITVVTRDFISRWLSRSRTRAKS